MQTMRFVTALLTCSASVAARPQESGATILKYDQREYDPKTGSYSYSFETSNGIQRSEEGIFKFPGTADEEKIVSGSYSYTDPGGRLITVVYTADKNGFHPIITFGASSSTTPPPQPIAVPASSQSGSGLMQEAFEEEQEETVKNIIPAAALASLSGVGPG